MPDPAPPHSKPPIRLAAGPTVAEFAWDRDRWHHEVIVPQARWGSLEAEADGRSDARWPASPVLVEVSLVALAGGPAVLGVGLAGRSHFSLSVTACPDRGDTLLFEAACRIQEPAAWLGSTYADSSGRVIRLEAGRPEPPATVSWSYRIGPGGVERCGPGAPSARA
jgi:hypothetical protein